jgi:predicted O-methyltransferase YrrM
MNFWIELEQRLHPRDRPPPTSWRPCYESKHALAILVQPRCILEIGVRAGYSAFSFLAACPQARYVGVDNNSDTHGGFRGAIEHAREILRPFGASILEICSADFAKRWERNHEPPVFDLVHIDGEHTTEGCFADLLLATQCHPRVIVVDDYLVLPEVKSACDQFRRH